MKNNSLIQISAVVAAVYWGLTVNLQAVPPPPVSVPDSGATGMLLGAAVCGLVFLKWKLKR